MDGKELLPTTAINPKTGERYPTHRWMADDDAPPTSLPPERRSELRDATSSIAIDEPYGTEDSGTRPVANISNEGKPSDSGGGDGGDGGDGERPFVPADPEVSRPLLAAVQSVAAHCDGAREEDGIGFNKSDTGFGRALAFVPVEAWSQETAHAAYEMLGKYKVQLGGFGIDYDGLEAPPKPEGEAKDIRQRGRRGVLDPYQEHVKQERSRERKEQKQREREEAERQSRRITVEVTADGKERFVIEFKYDPKLVSAVKSEVSGARFDGARRCWVAPAGAASDVVAFAANHDFIMEGSVSEFASGYSERAAKSEADARAADPNFDKKKNGTVELAADGRLVIDTPYNPEMVSEIRGLPGRRWDAANKVNVVDMSPEALAFAARHDLHLPGDLVETAQEQAAQQDAMVDLSSARAADLDLEGFGVELYDYQKAGVAYALQARRTFIADEPGLGKTFQAIATIEAAEAYPAVIVVPATLKTNWQREFAMGVGDDRKVLIISGRNPVDPALLAEADVVIVNYDILGDHVDALQGINPQAAVFDESHYLKNPKAARTVAAQSLADGVPDEGVILALTGTPVTNKTVEFIPQLKILRRLQDIAPSEGKFKWEYCDPEQDGQYWKFDGASNSEELQRKLRQVCYVRRHKADVLEDLPAKTRQSTVIDLPPAAMKEYRKVEQNVAKYVADRLVEQLRAERGTNATAKGVLDALNPKNDRYRELGFANKQEFEEWTRAKIRASAGAHLTQTTVLRRVAAKAKMDAATEWIENFQNDTGRKLIVFAHHVEVVDELANRYNAPKISGSVSMEDRQRAIDSFQGDPNTRVIVCNIRAAGVGITLTEASDVLFVEQDWTPAAMDQAEDRVHRIGQTADKVTAHYLLAAGTIDERMYGVVERKRKVVGAATDGTAIEDEEEGSIQAVFDIFGL